MSLNNMYSEIPKSSDFDVLEDKNAFNHQGLYYFMKSMIERQYGRDALNSAWEWFKEGWKQRADYDGY